MDIPKYLSQEQLKKFFKEIKNPRDLALFGVIYHYGLRVSEALWLQVSDIDLRHKRIRIKRLKNGIPGEKPLWADTAKALRSYLRVRLDRGSDLFTGREGPLTRYRVSQLFYHYAKKAGVKEFSVHSLRHSIAVHMLEGGYDVLAVKDHLGHVNIQNTVVYTHITNPLRKKFFTNFYYNPSRVKI